MWDVHGAGLDIYFLKFLRPQSLSPAAGVRHLSSPRDFWTRSRRGEGAEGLCSLKTTLPWEFPVAISHGQTPSSGWKRRHARLWVPSSQRRERGRERLAAHPRSPRSPASGPAAESPDVGFNPYAGSFISIKGQRLRGAEIAAAAGAPRLPRTAPAPAPSPGVRAAPCPERDRSGRRGEGERRPDPLEAARPGGGEGSRRAQLQWVWD